MWVEAQIGHGDFKQQKKSRPLASLKYSKVLKVLQNLLRIDTVVYVFPASHQFPLYLKAVKSMLAKNLAPEQIIVRADLVVIGHEYQQDIVAVWLGKRCLPYQINIIPEHVELLDVIAIVYGIGLSMLEDGDERDVGEAQTDEGIAQDCCSCSQIPVPQFLKRHSLQLLASYVLNELINIKFITVLILPTTKTDCITCSLLQFS